MDPRRMLAFGDITCFTCKWHHPRCKMRFRDPTDPHQTMCWSKPGGIIAPKSLPLYWSYEGFFGYPQLSASFFLRSHHRNPGLLRCFGSSPAEYHRPLDNKHQRWCSTPHSWERGCIRCQLQLSPGASGRIQAQGRPCNPSVRDVGASKNSTDFGVISYNLTPGMYPSITSAIEVISSQIYHLVVGEFSRHPQLKGCQCAVVKLVPSLSSQVFETST